MQTYPPRPSHGLALVLNISLRVHVVFEIFEKTVSKWNYKNQVKNLKYDFQIAIQWHEANCLFYTCRSCVANFIPFPVIPCKRLVLLGHHWYSHNKENMSFNCQLSGITYLEEKNWQNSPVKSPNINISRCIYVGCLNTCICV